MQYVTKIEEVSLRFMRYKIVNKEIFQKCSKGKKRSVKPRVSPYLETLVNLEDFTIIFPKHR